MKMKRAYKNYIQLVRTGGGVDMLESTWNQGTEIKNIEYMNKKKIVDTENDEEVFEVTSTKERIF